MSKIKKLKLITIQVQGIEGVEELAKCPGEMQMFDKINELIEEVDKLKEERQKEK